ncbi:MAG: DMT family transporter [Thermoanaerobaculaceae bacterium]|nr:DMT family transporter [Thermoanaerobaculaceae bacterium]
MNGPAFAHAGEVFSLLAALVWSGAVILYKRSSDTVDPVGLNLFKNLFGLLLLVPTVLLVGGSGWQAMTTRDVLALVASGILGISVSDTYLFRSLQLLGAGLYSIVVCLYGAFVVGASYLFLGERLAAGQLAGVVLVTAAIAVAVHEPDRQQHERRQILAGVAWGVVAMASLALSIVLMKGALARVGALDAVTLRIGAGFLALLPVGLVGRSGRRSLATLTASRAHWRFTIPGSFLGMYGSSILWVLGMKHTLASIASSLNQLSNVFVFILGVVFLHERLTWRKVLGLAVATVGALLIILAG